MENHQEKFKEFVEELHDANENSITEIYNKTANLILNHGFIKVNEKKFKIREIEFYYYSEEEHEDIFTHGFSNDEKDENSKKAKVKQLTSFQWYFHPNLTGVDLTIGNKNNFGGILIRGINDEKGKLIDGPFNVLKTILDEQTESIFERNSINIFFGEIETKTEKIIVSSRRIGLNKEKRDPKEFLKRSYRYLLLERDIKNNTKNNNTKMQKLKTILS